MTQVLSDGSEALKGDAGAIQALAGESLSPWSSAHNCMLFSSLAADLPVYWRTDNVCAEDRKGMLALLVSFLLP